MHTKLDLLRDIHTLDLDPKGTLLIHSSCRAIARWRAGPTPCWTPGATFTGKAC